MNFSGVLTFGFAVVWKLFVRMNLIYEEVSKIIYNETTMVFVLHMFD